MRHAVGNVANAGSGVTLSGLAFAPAWIIAKVSGQIAVLRTTTMATDSAKPMVSNLAPETGSVTSLTGDGAVFGTNARVTGTIRYLAGEAVAGESAVGTYTGNANTARAITVGFAPDLVMVWSEGANALYWHTSTMPDEVSSTDATSVAFDATAASDRIQKIDASDGFQVGSANNVNSNGVVYHWLALKATAGALSVGRYAGTGTSFGVTGAGFGPTAVIDKRFDNTSGGVIRLDHAGSNAGVLAAGADATTYITSLDADGFTVASTTANVNAASATYDWAAFGAGSGGGGGGATAAPRLLLLGVG